MADHSLCLSRLLPFLFVVLGITGCAAPQLPDELKRFPVTLWQTRAEDQLNGAVQETVVRGEVVLSGSDVVSRLPTLTRRYSESGIRVLKSEQGSDKDVVEKILVNHEIPVRKEVWESGQLTRLQEYRYDSQGDLVNIEPPVGNDTSGAWIGPGNLSYATGTALDGRQADFFYGGDFRRIPGSQRQEHSPCWQVGYLKDMQLLRTCDSSRFEVLVLDERGRLLQRRLLASVPDVVQRDVLLKAPATIDEQWKWLHGYQPLSYVFKGESQEIHKSWHYSQGNAVLERRHVVRNGKTDLVEERRYGAYVFDEHGNWIARNVAVWAGSDQDVLKLSQNETWKRRITYWP